MLKFKHLNEEWRDIKGYEGLYQVSNYGRVKRNNSLVNSKNGSKRIVKEHVIKQYVENSGYLYCILSINSRIKKFFIHRLVARAFPEICGEWFEGCDVHHINGNKKENCVSNLTVLQRTMHRKEHNRKPVLQYDLNGNLIKEWESTIEIERCLGFCNANISRCCLNKKYRHTAYGYIWKYKE